jgi:hypothetical protein
VMMASTDFKASLQDITTQSRRALLLGTMGAGVSLASLTMVDDARADVGDFYRSAGVILLFSSSIPHCMSIQDYTSISVPSTSHS